MRIRDIVGKYVEMKITRNFRKGNERATRIGISPKAKKNDKMLSCMPGAASQTREAALFASDGSRVMRERRYENIPDLLSSLRR